jgi:1-acyl-sn-glycerol-3-phosphate acyltransferase
MESQHSAQVEAGKSVTDQTASDLIAVVDSLTRELHPHLRRTLVVRLDSNLDRDLGFDSLARAELLLRLDRTFRIRLPERLISDAETLNDLLQAVLAAAANQGIVRDRATIKAVELPETTEPVGASTLLDVLFAHVKLHSDRPHLWLWRSDSDEHRITYGELAASARAAASGLLKQGVQPGDRVAIMLPTEAGFFFAFFGVLMAGGIPVPIYPPFRRSQIEEHLRRQAGILRNAEASILITNQEIHNVGALLFGLVESLRRIETIEKLQRYEPLAEPVLADADTVGLIQYTSGSTGDPKGVVLSHANLLANIRAMGEIMQASSSDVFVSWLPLYHDMGLIGAWLGSLYYGAQAIIMPPLAFLADPARWLWTIHRHRGTLSAAPNFAFELCLKNIRDQDIEGLDLSSLRMVVNGAEPVSPSTIRRFTERFAPYGFRPEAMAPVYGLAECSVGLAFPPPGRLPIIDHVQRDALARQGMALPAAPEDPSALEFPACGQPIPRHQVRIVDDRGSELPERREGRLQFKGPSTTKGYYRNEEKTRTLFDGDWLESGDRAYVAGGDVFITGRIKDMIIRAGRNIYPHELEELVGNIDGVRKGCVAVFASPDVRTGTERLVVLAETRLTDPEQLERLRQRIIEASAALLELPPDEVVLAPPRTVPKTSSGKIRRSAARSLYETGALNQRPTALWWQLTRLSLAGLAHRLRRSGQVMAELAYAGWWWSILCIVAAPVYLCVMALPRRRWRHAVITLGARGFLKLVGLTPRIEAEAMIPSGAAMIIANHASYLDGAVLAATIPGELSFIAKQELAEQLIAGPFLRRIGTIFVRRTDARGGVEDTAAALAAAQAGKRIVSFPEGTFARMPGLLGFRLGAFMVAAQADIPVVPVVLRGTRSILRSDQWFPRHGPISVHIGRTFAAGGHDFDAAVRLRDAARAAVLVQCGEPDLVREPISLS